MNEIPDTIIPMPLHWKRICQRGFNHATEISREVSRQLGIDVNHSLLKRKLNTISQTGLNEIARHKNVRGAFSVNLASGDKGSRYKHIALLDDVVTSGSTIGAAAKALRSSGIERISVWAIAKT